MHPILLKLGTFEIHTYGVIVFLGVAAGFLACRTYAKKEGIPQEAFSDIFFWTLVSGFIGGRVVYLAVEYTLFLQNPFRMLFGRSGFVFYGGVIFGLPALYFLTRKYLKSSRFSDFLKILDIFAVGMPLGHAIGRVGCFFEGCCYGRPTNSFIGMLFPPDSAAGYLGEKVIPTQLVESFFLFLIFLAIIILARRKRFNGQLLSFYLVGYGLLRFIVEFFRGDPRGQILFLSTSQFISLFMIIIGIIFKISRRST